MLTLNTGDRFDHEYSAPWRDNVAGRAHVMRVITRCEVIEADRSRLSYRTLGVLSVVDAYPDGARVGLNESGTAGGMTQGYAALLMRGEVPGHGIRNVTKNEEIDRRLWPKEHADAEVPARVDALVAAGVLCDLSYRNDIAASFCLAAFADDHGDGWLTRLWVHPVDPAAREFPDLPRFIVCRDDDSGMLPCYMGDDIEAALSALAWRF